MRLLSMSTPLFCSMALALSAHAQEKPPEEIAARDVGDTAPQAKQAPATTPATTAPDGELSPIDGVVGHLGFGYFTGFAPVGVRYWLDRTAAVDFGIDASFFSGNTDAHRYALEAGYVIGLAHYHYSVVFVRGGLGLRFLDDPGDQAKAAWDVNGNLFVGAELFLGALGFPNISLQGGYGIEGRYRYQGGSSFLLGTASGGLSVTGAGTLGFHIYL